MTSLEHSFVGSSVAFAFGYNKVHQVTSQSVDNADYAWPGPTAYAVVGYGTANNLNQYPSVAGNAFGYDLNGNLTSGPLAAAFDELNRVTQIVSGTVTNNYWNDPLNRQPQKQVNGTKTGFLYDGAQLIAEYDDTPTLVNRYIPGAGLDEMLVQISGSDTTFLHKDRLGSPIAQTDDSGAVLNEYIYSPFGETPSLTGTAFGFTGQRYDPELGLYNYKARYYSPGIGRFFQPDPLGYGAGDMNLYAYVGNDALNLVDPSGLDSVFGPQQVYGAAGFAFKTSTFTRTETRVTFYRTPDGAVHSIPTFGESGSPFAPSSNIPSWATPLGDVHSHIGGESLLQYNEPIVQSGFRYTPGGGLEPQSSFDFSHQDTLGYMLDAFRNDSYTPGWMVDPLGQLHQYTPFYRSGESDSGLKTTGCH